MYISLKFCTINHALSNFYGKSKLEAEKGIESLESEHFKVAIIRPPMIYGKGSKGNYRWLCKGFAKAPEATRFWRLQYL